MSASSVLAQLKLSTLTPRSVYIKCVPPPTSFYERRAVFFALQRSSQHAIETFKKLQDASSFIAVAASTDAAKSLIKSSPLQETLVSQDPESSSEVNSITFTTPFKPGGAIANPINIHSADSDEVETTPASTSLGLSSKTFTLHIFPANTSYDHKDEIRKSPLFGPWPGDGRPGDNTPETFMSAALKRVIPPGAMAPALRDWETGNQLARDTDSYSDDGIEGAAFTLLGMTRLSARQVFFMERLRRRGANQFTPEVMNGLVQYAEKHKGNYVASKTTTAKEPQFDPFDNRIYPAESQQSESGADDPSGVTAGAEQSETMPDEQQIQKDA